MATQKPIAIGVLLLVILSTSILITMDNNVRMKITAASATFYVPDPANPILWLVSGVEYTKMYSGSTSIARNTTTTKLQTTIDNLTKDVIVTRTAPYKGGILVTDTWKYNGDVTEKELFPISHSVRVQNAAGKIFRYEVQKLVYSGSAKTFTTETKMPFGRNMYVEWQPGYSSAKLSAAGTLQVNYKVASDDETYLVRLFDPNPPNVTVTLTWPPNGLQNASTYQELSAHYVSSVNPWCYQEQANVSTSCGGLNTGSYATNSPSATRKVYDSNWSSSEDITTSVWYMNYSKVSDTNLSSRWQVKDGIQTANLTIPQTCWDYNASRLSFSVSNTYSNYTVVNNTFTYTITDAAHWHTPSNGFDKDWDTLTWADGDSTFRYAYVNYTKPNLAVAATWRTKDFKGVKTWELPTNCWNQTYPYLKINIYDQPGMDTGVTQYECWNGASYTYLGGSSAETAYLYEQELIWTIYNNTKTVKWNCLNASGWQTIASNDGTNSSYEEGMWWYSTAAILQNITYCQWDGYACLVLSQAFNIPMWPETDTYLWWRGLIPNTTYRWFVMSSGLQGTSFSEMWNFTTLSGTGVNVDYTEVELGSVVNVTGIIPGSNPVCLDVIGYGVNVSCGISSTNYLFSESFFRRTTDNLSRSSILGKAASTGFWGTPAYNQTFYIPIHKNTIYQNFTIDLTGYLCGFPCIGLYPSEVRVFVNDTQVAFVPVVQDVPTTTDYYFSDNGSTYAADWNVTYTFLSKQARKTFYMVTPGNAVPTSMHVKFTPKQITIIDADGAIPGTAQQQFDANVWNAQSFKASGKNLTNFYPEMSRTGGTTCNLNMTIRTVLNNASTQVGSCYVLGTAIPTSGGSTVSCNFTTPVSLTPGVTYYIVSKGQGTCDYPSGAYLSWWKAYDSDPNGQRYRYYSGNWTGYPGEDLGWMAAYSDYPYNPWLEVGNVNGIREWNYSSGYLRNPVNFTITNVSSMVSYLSTCTQIEGLCWIPAWIYSETPGQMQVGGELAVDFIYNYSSIVPTTVSINTSLLTRYLERLGVESANIPITVNTTIQNGYILVDDIKLDYLGGNKTIIFLAHSVDYSANESINLTEYYSGYNWTFPSRIYYLEFIPSSPTSKNVTPYGQSATKPIFNITMLNWGGRTMDWSIWLNETYSCVNITASPTPSKADGQVLKAYTYSQNQSWCYQETANVSSGCAPSTGAYGFGPRYIFVNYTKPSDVTNNSLWMVKHGGLAEYNISIPSLCWNYNSTKLLLAMFTQANNSCTVGNEEQSQPACFNGTGWQRLGTLASSLCSAVGGGPNSTGYGAIDGNWSTYASYILPSVGWCNSPNSCDVGGTSYAYEEAMWWDLNPTIVSTNWYELASNKSYYDTQGVWMWADYNCSGVPGWAFWEPYFYFRGCCVGCLCDEDV